MNAATAEAVSTYENIRALAATWGLIIFGFIFLGAVAYAFWPSRQKQFERNAQIPLREDDDV